MIPDGTYTAVVDRFEDDLAVLEVSGEDDRYELVVSESDLPADGRHQDAVLGVVVEDGGLVEATYNEAVTEQRKEEAQSRFDRLSKRPPDDEL